MHYQAAFEALKAGETPLNLKPKESEPVRKSGGSGRPARPESSSPEKIKQRNQQKLEQEKKMVEEESDGGVIAQESGDDF